MVVAVVGDRDRHRQTQKQTDRNRQADRQKQRHTDTETHRNRQTDRQKQTVRQT